MSKTAVAETFSSKRYDSCVKENLSVLLTESTLQETGCMRILGNLDYAGLLVDISRFNDAAQETEATEDHEHF